MACGGALVGQSLLGRHSIRFTFSNKLAMAAALCGRVHYCGPGIVVSWLLSVVV